MKTESRDLLEMSIMMVRAHFHSALSFISEPKSCLLLSFILFSALIPKS